MQKILIADDDRATRQILRQALVGAGFSVSLAADGKAALRHLRKAKFDFMLLDVWMPGLNGLELLAQIRSIASPPRVTVMTSDRTPDTLLRAVKEQAYRFIRKPLEPGEVVELVQQALSGESAVLPIEVLSARPHWVELLIPCERLAADRVQEFLNHLEIDLPDDIRNSIGQAFHELLLNAVEWGGKWDPNRKVRISCVRLQRLLIYRISDPGPGFRFEDLKHAAISNPEGDPLAHLAEREKKALRPGGLGLLMTRQIVDDLVYNEAQNEVMFVKYLS